MNWLYFFIGVLGCYLGIICNFKLPFFSTDYDIIILKITMSQSVIMILTLKKLQYLGQ